jgi:glycosyltransferase involved in cell wall biosynthesis
MRWGKFTLRALSTRLMNFCCLAVPAFGLSGRAGTFDPMKKKIIIAITQSNFGGAQRYVHDLATSLPAAEYDVHVVAGGSGRMVEELKKKNIKVTSLKALQRNVSVFADVAVFFEFFWLLKTEKPDIVHLNSSKMGGIGALAARVARVPRIIFTAHGWEFNAPRPFWQRRLIRFFSTVIVQLSHLTIAVSNSLREQMPMALRQKVVVVHNGIAREPLFNRQEARAALAARAGVLVDESLWIGSVAELHPVKGLEYALKAFAEFSREHPDAHYFICGEGRERGKLERLARESGIEKQVHFIGFLADAPRYLCAFDIFLAPSISEALSLSILEAGIAARAVVATRVGGVPEIIHDSTEGTLVPSRDAPAIASALKALAADPGLREKTGHALQKRVERNFLLERMVSDTIAVYKL